MAKHHECGASTCFKKQIMNVDFNLRDGWRLTDNWKEPWFSEFCHITCWTNWSSWCILEIFAKSVRHPGVFGLLLLILFLTAYYMLRFSRISRQWWYSWRFWIQLESAVTQWPFSSDSTLKMLLSKGCCVRTNLTNRYHFNASRFEQKLKTVKIWKDIRP